jgi:peptidylprolyl isomerase
VETRAAYDLNRARFLMPRRYRLEQIYVAIAPTDKNGAAALQKAKSLAAKARDGRTRFEDLARKNSQHKTSAEQGGDTGWLAEGDLLPEIRARIQGMAKGEVSEPIRAGEGWHIVRLMDTQAAGPQPLAEVRPMIVAAPAEGTGRTAEIYRPPASEIAHHHTRSPTARRGEVTGPGDVGTCWPR